MEIAKYTAGFSIDFSKADISKLDKQLAKIETKVKAFNKNLGGYAITLVNFKVNQKNLQVALGNAMDMASARIVFEVRNFHIDQAHLNAQMQRAISIASHSATPMINPHINPSVRPTVAPGNGGSGGGGTRRAATAGFIGGGLSSFYGPALALGLGGYGLGAVNKLNQKVVAAELQSQAVVQQAGGTTEQGTDSFNWLRQTAKRVGFNYLDATQGYNNTLSGLTHAGMTVGQGQNVFKGFSEIGRVMKLDATHQKRLFYAVSEVADMNELQKRQLNMIALALPGGKSLFAEAWQKQLKDAGKGGNLTGQAAEDALLKAIKARQIKGNILTQAADLASERAAPNIMTASHASQGEQARYQNSVSDLAVLASNSGVEEGFARIFRTLSAGLDESGDLVKGLAEGFNEATKWASELMLFPQSFIRALEGKDSIVSDWLGIDKAKELQEDWKNIKQIFTDISSVHFDFLPTLEATSKEIASIMHAIADFQRWVDSKTPTTEEEPGKNSGTKGFLENFMSTNSANHVGDLLDSFSNSMDPGRTEVVYRDKDSPFYQKPEMYDANQKAMAADQATESGQPMVAQQFTIAINVDPVTLSQMDVQSQAQDLGQWFRVELEKATVNFPRKE